MSNLNICVAGKNQCSIDFVDFILNYVKNKPITLCVLPNSSDVGVDTWQLSLKKHAIKNKIKIVTLEELYTIENLIFISIEFDKIIKTEKFITTKLYNFHFSLLPKYRGCHTNFLQIYNGEEYSGVTLHKINNGIDTGDIIDQIKFKIRKNDTGYENYVRLMKYSVKLLKKNFKKLINSNFKSKKQELDKGSYYSINAVDYKTIINITIEEENLETHNKIRSLIFPAYQYPVFNGKKIKRCKFVKNKIKLTFVD